MKTIHWLTSFRPRTPDDLKTTPLASIRLRTAVAADAIGRDGGLLTAGDKIAGDLPDILVIGKVGDGIPDEHLNAWRTWAQAVKARGGKLVVDYTDNVFFERDTKRGDFYRDIIAAADALVCPSAQMQSNARSFYAGACAVIEDAIEVACSRPKSFLHKPVTALWFGHNSNVRSLALLLMGFPQKSRLRIMALTDAAGMESLKNGVAHFPPKLKVEPGLWSVEAMISAAGRADLCLIPSELGNPAKNGASSNRLITALALGLPTAADLIDSYRAFSTFFVDLRTPEFATFLENPLRYSARVTEAQGSICAKFYPTVIGGKWREFLGAL